MRSSRALPHSNRNRKPVPNTVTVFFSVLTNVNLLPVCFLYIITINYYIICNCVQISEETDEVPGFKTPLTTSQFVEWSCAQFAQPASLENEMDDVESKPYLEREWR